MEFAERINALAEKVRHSKSTIETEEATKNALIMPFISQVLGYDVFNPKEVVPEFVADVGVKRGEKIDYAIMENDAVRLLIECKKVSEPLNFEHASQLFRYFSVTEARIAILTNGQEYQVYTDIHERNKMDQTPFLVFDLLDIDHRMTREIQKFSKESFDIDSVINSAEELKYVGMIRRILATEFKSPTDEWLRFFISKVHDGRATQKVVEQFREIVARAAEQYISDQVNERLTNALTEDVSESNNPPSGKADPESSTEEASQQSPDQDIVTTDEELEAFNIVRAIAVSEVAPERIAIRDAKTYCAVLLDNNSRKPIIRFYFNAKSVKFVTTFEKGKNNDTRHDVESAMDIYRIADYIRSTIRDYTSS